MIRHFAAVLTATVLLAGPAAAQQSLPAPIPLYPGAAPRSIEPEPLPPARSEPAAAMPLPPPAEAVPPPTATGRNGPPTPRLNLAFTGSAARCRRARDRARLLRPAGRGAPP